MTETTRDAGYAGCVLQMHDGMHLVTRATYSEDDGHGGYKVDLWTRLIGEANAPVRMDPNNYTTVIEGAMIPDGTTVPYTFPAYAAGVLAETITLTMPPAWWFRVAAVASRMCYGPTFNRSILWNLCEMSDCVRRGYSALAYDHLVSAERHYAA